MIKVNLLRMMDGHYRIEVLDIYDGIEQIITNLETTDLMLGIQEPSARQIAQQRLEHYSETSKAETLDTIICTLESK
jgi:hypothetical protein